MQDCWGRCTFGVFDGGLVCPGPGVGWDRSVCCGAVCCGAVCCAVCICAATRPTQVKANARPSNPERELVFVRGMVRMIEVRVIEVDPPCFSALRGRSETAHVVLIVLVASISPVRNLFMLFL
ncbi:hypothetical protein [Tunturiibacter gelidiferens]|uniref:hypothetical protein n=1 Tax=Tunturiibacter gelidiferens TaxID=3069689 RepID=UPI003D9AC9AC